MLAKIYLIRLFQIQSSFWQTILKIFRTLMTLTKTWNLFTAMILPWNTYKSQSKMRSLVNLRVFIYRQKKNQNVKYNNFVQVYIKYFHKKWLSLNNSFKYNSLLDPQCKKNMIFLKIVNTFYVLNLIHKIK